MRCPWLVFFTFVLTSALALAEPLPEEPIVTAVGTSSAKKSQFEIDYAATSSVKLRPHAFLLEALGRGLLYSLNYDFSVIREFAVGAGFSYVKGDPERIWTFPVFLNFYPLGRQHRLLLTAGPTFFLVENRAAEESFRENVVAGDFGVGYEYRGDGGVLFRAVPYYSFGKIQPFWFGLGAGYAF